MGPYFTFFTQNYNKSKNMKSKIKLEIHLSTNEVHLVDVVGVTVSLKHGKLRTTLFTNTTDSHFCLKIPHLAIHPMF